VANRQSVTVMAECAVSIESGGLMLLALMMYGIVMNVLLQVCDARHLPTHGVKRARGW
jgi:hypothetical protein